MITTFFLEGIYQMVYLIMYPVRILPTATLSSGVADSITNINTFLSTLHGLLPITCTTILVIVTAVMVLEATVLSWKVVMWIIRRFPTQS